MIRSTLYFGIEITKIFATRTYNYTSGRHPLNPKWSRSKNPVPHSIGIISVAYAARNEKEVRIARSHAKENHPYRLVDIWKGKNLVAKF
tara:strand:- start:2453 stop:2719 length:267 start_codon:yes stop_codon:yes gene_type:complete